MEQTGHLRSLADRLQEKAEQERIETEKLFKEQLQIMSSSLQTELQGALHTMSDAMAQELTNTTAKLNQDYQLLSQAFARKWVSTAILGLFLCLGMMLAGWMLVKLGLWRLNNYLSELAQLEQDCQAQRETLANLNSETWGLELMEVENGRFIVFPPGMKPGKQIWAVEGRKAVKMEE